MKDAPRPPRWLDWLVVAVALVTVGTIGWRRLRSYVADTVNQALVPVSDELSNLTTSLAQFEQDLLAVKQPLPAKQPVAAKPSVEAGSTGAGGDVATVTDGSINLNTASLAQLMELPGIGQAYATRIIEGRPYSSVAELTRVKGIGEKTLAKLSELVTAE